MADYETTAIESIPIKVNELRATFHSQKTKPVEFRLVQLRKLYWSIKDHEAALVEACQKDIGKATFETYLTEIDWCTNDIVFVCKHLKKWAKDEKAPDIPLSLAALKPSIRKDPLGCVLIIGPYNFPVQLAVCPFIGAIAAGNTALLKPSENAPSVAAVVQRIVESALDPTCYGIVQGGVAETTLLLDQRWDKIFYTGSQSVGKIIAKKAAETLTPVTLELGGRNPAIVTKHANARLAARRLLWGKTLNAGQVCISHNYTLVDRDILPAFVAEMKIAMKQFYPQGAKASRDYGRIINARQWNRLKRLVDESNGKILIGGEMDESDKFIEPTLIQVNDFHDSLVMEETFGPLMPIIPVDDLDHAIRIASEVHSTPLGIYPFGTKQEAAKVLQEIRSGGASVNDAFFHGSIPTLAFGGVGDSGHGNYRGRASFDCFSHRRSVTTTPWWVEKLVSVRYPPYEGKLAKIRKMSKLKPNFDREGKVNFSWVIYLLTLGAGSLMGGLTRLAVIILAALSWYKFSGRGLMI